MWIMVLLTECADMFPGRSLLSVHVANAYMFDALVDKATETLN